MHRRGLLPSRRGTDPRELQTAFGHRPGERVLLHHPVSLSLDASGGRFARLPLIDRIAGAAEAEPVHASLGVRSISLGGSDTWRAINPPTTTESLVGTMIRAFRISVGPISVIVRIVPIGGPFGDIACHVEDSVRAERVLVFVHRHDRRIEKESLRPIPHRPGQSRASEIRAGQASRLIPPGIDPPVCATSRFFPFGRSGESLAGPLTVPIRIEPRDMHHRMARYELFKRTSPLPIPRPGQIVS